MEQVLDSFFYVSPYTSVCLSFYVLTVGLPQTNKKQDGKAIQILPHCFPLNHLNNVVKQCSGQTRSYIKASYCTFRTPYPNVPRMALSNSGLCGNWLDPCWGVRFFVL